ncbi:IclR family transcriptional regulator [Bradyrhizobium mercantei]|uniref:IclR family transcriptional regulator n=1 Tax=Bradyrhizobium mercantei TaxID=1904807 RepID=UPI0009F957B6|nr:IclR family transcriptional regulator [Bradyrhizobium mercantei]
MTAFHGPRSHGEVVQPTGQPMAGRMSHVRAVHRAVTILKCFTPEAPTLSLIDLEHQVGLSRSTLYRLLHTLCATGLVETLSEPERFRLASGVMQLAHAWLSGTKVADLARAHVEDLRDQTGETAALFLFRDDASLCVLECGSRHCLSVSRRVGESHPMTHDASGLAILAFRDNKPRLRTPGDVERKELVDAIDRARSDGYAVDRGEFLRDATSIAAPIFDRNSAVIGSVALFAPNARMNDEMLTAYIKLTVSTAKFISDALGLPVVGEQSNVAGLRPLKVHPKAPQTRRRSSGSS